MSPTSRPAARARAVVVAALVAAGLVAGLVVASLSGDDEAETAARAPSAASPHANGGPRGGRADATTGVGGVRWTDVAEGAALTFRLETSVRQETAQGVLEASVLMRARLELAPAPAAGVDWFAGRLVEPQVEADPSLVGPLELDPNALTRGLDAPFLLRWTPTAGVIERRFADAMPVGGRNAVAVALGALQVAGDDATEDAGRWEAEEEHGEGALLARYTRDERGLTKVWRREEGRSPLAEGDSPAPIVHTGETTWGRDAEGREAARFDGRSAVDLTLQAGAPARFEGVTRIEATRVAAPDIAWASTLRPDAAELALRPPAPEVENEPPARDEVDAGLAAATPDALIELGAQATDHRDWARRRQVARALHARMSAEPAVLDAVVARLREAPADDNDLRTMIEALLSVDSPRAHLLVASLLTDRAAPRTHRQLLVVGATFSKPPDVVVAALEEASAEAGSDEAATAALLALAGQARLRAEGEPELVVRLRARLLERAREVLTPDVAAAVTTDPTAPLGPAPTPGAVIAWLDALGNLGEPEVWPLVEPWLAVQDHRIRRAAADALRFVPTAPARLKLATLILEDPDDDVRQTAVRATAYQPQAAFEGVVLRALDHDPSKKVRVAAAASVARWAYLAPTLYERLRRAAEREADPDVRDIYLGLLPVNHSAEGAAPEAAPASPGVLAPLGPSAGGVRGGRQSPRGADAELKVVP